MQSTRSGSDEGGRSGGLPDTSTAHLRGDVRRACDILREIVNRAPRIVILGEGNSGKTTLANRLVGGDLLPSSIVHNTRYSTLIRYSPEVELWAVYASGERVPIRSEGDLVKGDLLYLDIGLPYPRLRNYEVLDAHHGAPPEELLDLAGPGTLQIPIWCTVATQAWKSSEQRTWFSLPRRHRIRGMLAVTCGDRVVESGDRRKLLERLSAETGTEFAALALAPDPWVGTTPIEESVAAHAMRLRERRRMVGGRLSRRIIRLGNSALGGDDFPLVSVV